MSLGITDVRPRYETIAAASTFNPRAPRRSGYIPPGEVRPFRDLPRIGLDIETYDPDLKTMGPGAHRQGSILCGVGVAYSEHDATYYPTNHVDNERNMDEDKVYDALREEAKHFKGEIVGAKLYYDLQWLAIRKKIYFPQATIRDVQIAEPLLDENRFTYNLDSLANKYLGLKKETDDLQNLYGDYINNMHRVDPGHCAKYCEADTTLAWRVLDKQLPQIDAEELWLIFEVESALPPMLVHMRELGVPVDIAKAEETYEVLGREFKETVARIKTEAGMAVDVWSGPSISKAFNKLGIDFPLTSQGKPSFRKAWLNAHPHPIAKMIVHARGLSKISETFIKSAILENHVNGHIYCDFNQLRSDEGGAVSGRFSSSNPNLQQVPQRDERLGPLMRSMFIPFPGMRWGSLDWAQMEYRLLIHFAHLTPNIDASDVVAAYHADPSISFHKKIQELTDVTYFAAKTINLGVSYGMGKDKLAAMLGVNVAEAQRILGMYHARAPFVKKMLNTASARANVRGYIKTILGRKRRFPAFEVNGKVFQTRDAADDYASTRGGYPKRFGTHRALNALNQGSNADIMKRCMGQMWKEGLFNEGIYPHLTVHDEFDVSVENEKSFARLAEIMRDTVKLEIPLMVDSGIGENWSSAH